MAIVKQYHKDTNTTYVYESESYWDAEKGQSRSRRRVIGKIDPETGEIIPTGKRGRKKKDPAQDIPGSSDGIAALYAQSLEKIQALEARIRTLEQQVSGLERRNEKLTALIRKSDRLLMQNHQMLVDSLGEE